MSTPEISVVIPAYNVSKYIADSITSVLNQSYPNWELIAVDDGSTDNTAEIISGFLTDKRIKLIKQPNKGVSAARNAGIRAAAGNYITFLDADDYYLPTNLEEKHNLLLSNSIIDFVYCDVMHCDEKLNDERVEKGVEPDNLFKKVLQWQGETIPTLPSNIMVKTNLMKEKFLFDEHLSNCADRYMKIILARDAYAAYLPKILVKYRNTPGSMSKKVWLLEKDELYIAHKIKEQHLIPEAAFRRKVLSNMYLIISGSWYTDAHKSGRALLFALKAGMVYPPAFIKAFKKVLGIKAKSKQI